MLYKSLPMTGFELRITGVKGDRSTIWPTTTVIAYLPFMQCPLVATWYARWSIDIINNKWCHKDRLLRWSGLTATNLSMLQYSFVFANSFSLLSMQRLKYCFCKIAILAPIRAHRYKYYYKHNLPLRKLSPTSWRHHCVPNSLKRFREPMIMPPGLYHPMISAQMLLSAMFMAAALLVALFIAAGNRLGKRRLNKIRIFRLPWCYSSRLAITCPPWAGAQV